MTMEEVATTDPKSAAKVFTLEECKKHVTEGDCWLIIHGKVYDVTKFLYDHPGGFDIVVASAGHDATEEFENIGHSKTAREDMAQWHIGEYAGGDPSAAANGGGGKAAAAAAAPRAAGGSSGLVALLKALLPLLVIVLALAAAKLLGGGGGKP